MKKRENYIAIFNKYVPEEFSPILSDLLLGTAISFKVVKGRKTKLGDFRLNHLRENPVITINGDLNPYSFLITSLHEFAHYFTFQKYGTKVLPHGEEWKEAYRKLILPVVTSGHLPKDIEEALMHSLVKTKASSCADINLSRILHAYNNSKTPGNKLEEIPKNTTFALNKRQFVKLNKRRTRYECKEVSTGRIFLVHALAIVTVIEENEE